MTSYIILYLGQFSACFLCIKPQGCGAIPVTIIVEVTIVFF